MVETMADVKAAFQTAVRRELSPVLRSAGFAGTRPTWRRYSAIGDCAIVNVQSMGLIDALRCVVNIDVVPAVWLDWVLRSRPDGPARKPSAGEGLFFDRLHPQGSPADRDVWWEVSTLGQVEVVIADMIDVVITQGIPVILPLLERDSLLETIPAGKLGLYRGKYGDPYFDRAEALILADRGPSDRLRQLLEKIEAEVAESLLPEKIVQQFVTFIKTRSAVNIAI